MGVSSADFSAVSTEGLVERVKRKISQLKKAADKARFRFARKHFNAQLDELLADLETEYQRFKAGSLSEEDVKDFRRRLIAVLNISGVEKLFRSQ